MPLLMMLDQSRHPFSMVGNVMIYRGLTNLGSLGCPTLASGGSSTPNKKSEALRQQGASLCLVLQVVLFVHDMCVVGVGTGRNPCRHPLAGRPIDSPLFGFARVWVLRVAWTASTMRCTLTTVASAIVCVAAIVSTIPQQVLHDYGRGWPMGFPGNAKVVVRDRGDLSNPVPASENATVRTVELRTLAVGDSVLSYDLTTGATRFADVYVHRVCLRARVSTP